MTWDHSTNLLPQFKRTGHQYISWWIFVFSWVHEAILIWLGFSQYIYFNVVFLFLYLAYKKYKFLLLPNSDYYNILIILLYVIDPHPDQVFRIRDGPSQRLKHNCSRQSFFKELDRTMSTLLIQPINQSSLMQATWQACRVCGCNSNEKPYLHILSIYGQCQGCLTCVFLNNKITIKCAWKPCAFQVQTLFIYWFAYLMLVCKHLLILETIPISFLLHVKLFFQFLWGPFTWH